MLPKPEKNKKNLTPTDETSEISPEVKVAAKRRLVAILLITTFGLSFIFWAYRYFSSKSFSFKLPTFTTATSPTLNLSLPYSFKKNQRILTNSTELNYDVIYSQLQKSTQNLSLDTSAFLPQGISLKYFSSKDYHSFLFITPQDPFIFVINSPTLPANQDLQNLLNQVYWFGIKL
ncbi:MAG TPA: hypothetical protein PK370_00810 [Candidatus Woesebacteria bacterium]|nr:hypothetical protein [Candidatus Woesebacteria bacterium]HPJ17438.1 hypothetical protein [Candidatus Woesebacteria bacterium]